MTTKTTAIGLLTARATQSRRNAASRVVATAAAFAACAVAAGTGCSGAPVDTDKGSVGAGATGSIGLQLTPGAGVVIDLVSYTIVGPNGLTRPGSIDVSNSSTLSAFVGGLPAGTGYTITLTATSTDNKTNCFGSATFDVVANTTTNVPVTFRCVKQKNNGSVIIGGTLNVCPNIDNLLINPLSAPVGGTITLGAVASDLDGLPAPLSYTWKTTGGTLGGASTAHATLTCTAAGTPLVTLTVSDGDPAPNCPATQSFDVTCTACSGDGTSCDDGNACTQSDACHSSRCSGSSAPIATPCAQGGGTVCDGSGHCVQCVTAANCPGSDTECSTRTCVVNACGVASSPAGTPVMAQTAGDCRRNECNGTGGITPAIDNTDLPVDGNACTADVCTAGVPSNPPAPPRTSCGGAKMCDGNGACVDCVAPTDCPGTDTSCAWRTCVAGTCGTNTPPYGTTCNESGGAICDGSGSCVPFTVRVARVGVGGDGGALGVTAAPVFIEARDVADGSVVGSPIALPTAASGANQPLTVGGLAVTDAQLSRSADEHYLVMAGYAAAPGSPNPANNVSFARVIGRIDAAANVDTSTVFSGAFITGTIRSAVSSDGNTFWAAGGVGAGTDAGGASGGIWTIQRGTTDGIQQSATPARSLGIAGGQLYMSGDSGAMLLLATVGTGLPTAPAQTLTSFAGMPGSGMSPWGFVFFDLNTSVAGIDTAYVASEVVGTGDAGAALRGIQKWTYNGATWSLAGTLSLAANVGFRSIAGSLIGGKPTLLASTADGTTSNRLVAFVDDGVTAPRVVATSSTNTFFRGVSLPPR
jgi:hypothetical protein